MTDLERLARALAILAVGFPKNCNLVTTHDLLIQPRTDGHYVFTIILPPKDKS